MVVQYTKPKRKYFIQNTSQESIRLKICLQADAVKRKETGTTQYNGKGGSRSLVLRHTVCE